MCFGFKIKIKYSKIIRIYFMIIFSENIKKFWRDRMGIVCCGEIVRFGLTFFKFEIVKFSFWRIDYLFVLLE